MTARSGFWLPSASRGGSNEAGVATSFVARGETVLAAPGCKKPAMVAGNVRVLMGLLRYPSQPAWQTRCSSVVMA